jgi:hypothetical protein
MLGQLNGVDAGSIPFCCEWPGSSALTCWNQNQFMHETVDALQIFIFPEPS